MALTMKSPEKRLEWLVENVVIPLGRQRRILQGLEEPLNDPDMREENMAEVRRIGWYTAHYIRQAIAELEEVARHCEEL